MKKQAYTLAEVLVALGIVGIIAAVSLPMISRFKLDTTKIMYLKTYDTLKEAIYSIANNENWYRKTIDFSSEGGNIVNIANYPLFDTHSIKKINGSKHHGVFAFHTILREVLNGKGGIDTFTMGDSPVALDISNNVNDSNTPNTQSMNSERGTAPHAINQNTQLATLYYFITADINGDAPPNSLYNPATPNVVPDRFTFIVLPSGELVAADPYGQAYLAERTSVTTNEKVFNRNREKLGNYTNYTKDNIVDSSEYADKIKINLEEIKNEVNETEDSASA